MDGVGKLAGTQQTIEMGNGPGLHLPTRRAGTKWQRSNFVFTTGAGPPLDGTLVTRDLKRILARTWLGGLPDCEHERVRDLACLDCNATRLPMLSFHGLRHSCASLLLAAGVPIRDVSELLGHSDVRLTLSTYAHVLDETARKWPGRCIRFLTANLTARRLHAGR